MITHIVVDTSYWLELFKVPKHFKEEYYKEIKSLFEKAGKNKYRLYLPIPVLFELANHIAYIDEGHKRRDLAGLFSKTVERGVSVGDPSLNIIPCMAFSVANELDGNLSHFVDCFIELVQESLSFTDSAIILEAQKLKKDTNKVHIWTTDKGLKAREPDPENEAFIGNT